MKKLIKYITANTIKPVLVKYLSKKRMYKRPDGLRLWIAPGVFHPAFFFSTRILLKYINNIPVKDMTLLELGAGSGLIAFSCAKRGAIVTATDINPTAIEYLHLNSKENNISPCIIHSDLFEQIPQQTFDFIIINPPYYKKDPANDAEHAWYCGENGEYFTKLFSRLGNYINNNSVVLMILNSECDINMIEKIGAGFKFKFELQHTIDVMIERLFIFRIF